MKRLLALLTVVLLAGTTARADEPAVSHMVYFELKEKTPEARQKLVDSAYKYLKGMDGVTYFSAGVRAEAIKEGPSQADWDVSLHVVFKDAAALKAYGPHEKHQKFIEENKAGWKGVKVYDSLITGK